MIYRGRVESYCKLVKHFGDETGLRSCSCRSVFEFLAQDCVLLLEGGWELSFILPAA